MHQVNMPSSEQGSEVREEAQVFLSLQHVEFHSSHLWMSQMK